MIQRIGLCICLYDILWTSEGLIGHGTGLVNVNGELRKQHSWSSVLISLVEFRMVVFRPFKGEVLMATINASTPSGIHLKTEFFHDIFVPYEELPPGAE